MALQGVTGKPMPATAKRVPKRQRPAAVQTSAPRGLLTRQQLATRWGVVALRISKWQDDGLPVARRGGRGRPSFYDPVACDAWKTAREAQQRANGGALSLAEERARQSRAQTRLTELAIRKREGELLEVGDVAMAWAAIVAAVKAKVLAIPSAVAERLVTVAQTGGAAAAEALLRDQVLEALRELATWEPPAPRVEARA